MLDFHWIFCILIAFFIQVLGLNQFALADSPNIEHTNPQRCPDRNGLDLAWSLDSSSALIAHAAGEIWGKTYTNSLEALDKNYARGYRVFELDFSLSADAKFVAVHDWDNWKNMTQETEIPTESEFAKIALYGRLHSLTLQEIELWLSKHADALLIADIKESRMNGLQAIRKSTEFPLHWLPEVYNAEEIEEALKLGFPEPILMTEWNQPEDQKITEIVKYFHIKWVGFPAIRLIFSSLGPTLHQAGAHILTHTVNSVWLQNSLAQSGAEIFYTEQIKPQGSFGFLDVCDWYMRSY
ncbi:MAG: glycerophosphodiester phosphodiesterase family protein [Proteobacteria bacterium]|nr:glycerophosphodiester phosphodiesterase family protein [Pseudomonadota bacterium]